MPSSLWGLTCMSWKITYTILNLSLLHIKSLRSLSARTMSSSSPSWEVRMQKRGRSTSLITFHLLSPLKKVGNQSFAFIFGVFGYLWASPSSSSLWLVGFYQSRVAKQVAVLWQVCSLFLLSFQIKSGGKNSPCYVMFQWCIQNFKFSDDNRNKCLALLFIYYPPSYASCKSFCNLVKVEEGRLVRLAQHFLLLIAVSPYL